MEDHRYDTSDSWRMLMLMINLVVVLVVLAFMYLILEDEIHDFLNRPKFTQEQLDKLTARGEMAQAKARGDNWNLIENGIHVKTGLIADKDLQLVIGACTSCHSAKLITQNRATRDGWKNLIDWMQETQGLPDLGIREPTILNYLAKHYAPQEVGRRKNIDVVAIEWYILNLDEETD